DNLGHLLHIDSTLYKAGWDDPSPFFVFAIQCPPDNRHGTWTEAIDGTRSILGKGDEMLTVSMEILDHLTEQYPIDDRKVVAVGISSGGTACWELLKRYPDRFAAVLPQGASGAR